MKYLVLAYGAEADWKELTPERQAELLKQDDVLRERGALIGAVENVCTIVTAPDDALAVTPGTFANPRVPLAGFAVIEAADLDEAVRLVADTPCVRAKGAVELRPLLGVNDGSAN